MIRWCIIGAGGIADRRTIPALLSDVNNKIVAVMDANGSVAENIGEKYNVKYYSDAELMLKENECDSVYISTPVKFHYEQAMTVLKYKRNAFIEKPIAMTAEDGKKLLDAFKSANLQLSVGYMMKYHNLNIKARDMVLNGEIGDVATIRLQFTCWYPDIKGAWRQNKAIGGGGAFMDLGVHCVELAEFILDDEIIDVKGFMNTKTFNYEVEDQAVCVFMTRKGVIGHIDVNFNIPDKASESKLEIYGSKGYIIAKGTLAQEEVGELSYLYSPQGEYSAQQDRCYDKPQIFYGENGNMYLKQIQNFCSIINSGIKNYESAIKAIRVQNVVDKFYGQM